MPASVYSRVARKREFSTLSLRSAVENGSFYMKRHVFTYCRRNGRECEMTGFISVGVQHYLDARTLTVGYLYAHTAMAGDSTSPPCMCTVIHGKDENFSFFIFFQCILRLLTSVCWPLFGFKFWEVSVLSWMKTKEHCFTLIQITVIVLNERGTLGETWRIVWKNDELHNGILTSLVPWDGRCRHKGCDLNT